MSTLVQPHATPTSISSSALSKWGARLAMTVTVAFLLMDSVMKLMVVQAVVDGMRQAGFDSSLAIPIGLILLACLAVYAIPQTRVFGALLLTGYLGGAIATHVRVGNPLLTHTLFPVYVAVLVWLPLYLRDPRIRALLTTRSSLS